MSKRIVLGRIGAAHGIRGEVVVQSFATNPLDLRAYGALTDEAGKRRFDIVSLRQAGKGLIARLKGVDDRNGAEALKGTALFVERDKLPEPAAGEFYLADLIGLRAVAPDGADIGEIIDVPNYGAGDLIEIKPDAGGETLLIPFTRDRVPSVEVSTGRILVIVPRLVEATPEADEEE